VPQIVQIFETPIPCILVLIILTVASGDPTLSELAQGQIFGMKKLVTPEE